MQAAEDGPLVEEKTGASVCIAAGALQVLALGFVGYPGCSPCSGAPKTSMTCLAQPRRLLALLAARMATDGDSSWQWQLECSMPSVAAQQQFL